MKLRLTIASVITVLVGALMAATTSSTEASAPRPAISLNSQPAAVVAAGPRPVALTGSVRGVKAGTRVTVQVRAAGRWKRIAVVAHARGRFAVIVSVGATSTFRAVVPGASDTKRVTWREGRFAVTPGPVPDTSQPPLPPCC